MIATLITLPLLADQIHSAPMHGPLVHAALASAGAWVKIGAWLRAGSSVRAGAWLAAFAHAAAPLAVAALWQGAAIAVVLGVGLKCAQRFHIHIDAAARFAVWAAAFAAVAALQFLPPILSLAVRGAASGSVAGAPDNVQIVAQVGTPAHAAWLRFPQIELPQIQIDERWALAIAAVWLMASLVRAAYLAAHALRLRRLWVAAEPVQTRAKLRALLAAASFARRPLSRRAATICTTRGLDRPSVIGFFAPRILIPDWLFRQLTPAELEQVVLHEAEHLWRRDDWTNLLQKIALVLFPLNPALVWIEQRLCREREMACDEGVVRRTQAPREYAACLAGLAERRMERRVELKIERRAHALSLGAFDRRPELVRRVSSLLARGPALHPVAARALVGVAACGLLAASVELARCPQMVEFVSAAPAAALESQPAQMNVARVDLAAPRDGGDRVIAQPGAVSGESGFRAVRSKASLPSNQDPVLHASSSHASPAGVWSPSLQPVSHPTDEDLSVGTPVWRPAVQVAESDFASQPGVVVFTAWEEVETLPRRGVAVADYDTGDSTGPQTAVSESDSENRAANRAARASIGANYRHAADLFCRAAPSANTVNAPAPSTKTPRPKASDSRRPSVAAAESGWLFFEL